MKQLAPFALGLLLTAPVAAQENQAANAVGELGKDLMHQDAGVRRKAAEQVGMVGNQLRALTGYVAELLKDPDPALRASAARSLGALGSLARDYAPALAEALADADPEVRIAAAYGLGGIGAEAARAVPALARALKDKDARVRRAAGQGLRMIGPAAKSAVPALIEALHDADDVDVPRGVNTRQSAAFALGDIGADAYPAVSTLLRMLEATDQATITAAGYALGRLAQAHEEHAIAGLLPFLQRTEHGGQRLKAAWILAEAGPRGKAAVPVLREALKTRPGEHPQQSIDFAVATLRALGLIGPEAASAVPDIVRVLRDRRAHVTVRSAAARALGGIGVAALPALVEAFKDPACAGERTWLARSLVQIGGPAVPHLAKLLKDSDRGVRYETVQALAAMHPSPPGVITALSQARNDADFSVRDAAERALRRLAPPFQ